MIIYRMRPLEDFGRDLSLSLPIFFGYAEKESASMRLLSFFRR